MTLKLALATSSLPTSFARGTGRRAPARPPGAPWRWAWAGVLLGLLGTLLLFAPAQWLAQGVAMATHDQLQLQEARGTVWHGSAQVVLTGGAGSRDAQALPGRITWALQPLNSEQQLSLRSDCCMPTPLHLHLRISPAWDGAQLQLSDTTSTWPAALLSGLGAPWKTMQRLGHHTPAAAPAVAKRAHAHARQRQNHRPQHGLAPVAAQTDWHLPSGHHHGGCSVDRH